MEYLWLNLALAAYFVCLTLALKRQFHMLQLSSYRNDRYASWVNKSFAGDKSQLEIYLPIISAAIMRGVNWGFAAALAACSVLMVIALPKKKEKKKFVVTARVKRLYCTLFALYIAALAVANILYKFTYESLPFILFIWVFALTAVYPLRCFVVLAVNGINAPIEKSIANGFIKDAKRILAEMPSLETVGITGSFGKTSTKYILQRILSEWKNTLMTPDSYNTPMGVVRTVRERLSPTDKIFVCEMGAKQRGDIKEICDIVSPDHCIITSVGNCHLESFKSIENVCNTKFELYDAVNGICVLNYDSAPVREREKSHGCISYGTTDDCDYFASDIICGPRGMSFTLNTKKGEKVSLTTKLLGRVNALNITGACAMALELGQDIKSMAYAVARLAPVPHRLELKGGAGQLVIDDAFNSNPEGAAQAVEVLGSFEGMYRVLITPGIVELGDDTERCNTELGRQAAPFADFVIGVAANAKYIEQGLSGAGYDMKNYFYAENLKTALAKLEEIRQNNTVVLFENDLPDNMENT